ncbi:hypothetical protein ACI65C_004880 [Semiaphis heraclei]
MENIPYKYLADEKHLVNIKHKLLNVVPELKKPNMTSRVQFSVSKDYTDALINHSNDNKYQNDNIDLESDEYDSDCSLGSLNSLYLRLKDNSNIPNLNKTTRISIQQLQHTECNLSETNSGSGNNEVPLSKPNNFKVANINHLTDNKYQNDNICLESDEYDSDCSLGSLNSLYFRLKDNSKILNSNKADIVSMKQLQPAICKLSKVDSLSGNNKVMKTKSSKKITAYDKTEDTKPIMKLNTSLFYGKQKSTSQHIFTLISHEFSFKKKFTNSKILKRSHSVCTYKYNTHKIRISSKKLKQRRYPTFQKTSSTNKISWENKYLIRSQLKETVPLLQFTAKCIKKNAENNEIYPWTNTDENLLPDKIEFIKDEHNIIKKEDDSSLEFSNTENQLYDTNNFLTNDFTDTDDFGGTVEIENIIKALDKDDLCIDNETHTWLKNEYHYEDQDEIQDKFCILFKEFNNF